MKIIIGGGTSLVAKGVNNKKINSVFLCICDNFGPSCVSSCLWETTWRGVWWVCSPCLLENGQPLGGRPASVLAVYVCVCGGG